MDTDTCAACGDDFVIIDGVAHHWNDAVVEWLDRDHTPSDSWATVVFNPGA